MGYTVIEAFVDLQDNNHLYGAGDEFPRAGHDVTLSRLSELMSAKNMIGRPLIKEGKATKKKSDDPVTKEDVEKMQFFALKALATKNGIDPEGKKGAELKAEIIEKLNL